MRRIAVLLGLAGVVLVAVFAWQAIAGGDESPESAGSSSATASATERAPSTALRSAESTTSGTVSEPSTPKARTSVAPEIVDGRAVIRGRCVDESAAPLAGVRVRLEGNANERGSLATWRMDHGDPDWKNPEPVASDQDGRFELRFSPLPPFSFRLYVQPVERVWLEKSWPSMEAGAVHELGELVLVPGVRVRGLVLDEQSAPVGNLAVYLSSATNSPARDGVELVDSGHGRTDARGAFALDRALPPGPYRTQLPGRELSEPKGELALAMPDTELRLIVATIADDPRRWITGLVVDARGAPIPGAEVFAERLEFWATRTRKDGSFRVERREATSPDAIPFGAGATGYTSWRSPEPVAWGTKDLRITLAEGPPLTIRVRRASDDAPVERFGIRFAPSRRGGWSSSDEDLLHAGVHEGGVLAFPRASPGRFSLTVIPAESTGLPPSPRREVVIEPGVPAVVDVRLAPPVERAVVVVTARGEPVRDARVELLWHPLGGAVQLAEFALDERNARMNGIDRVVLCEAASSDAAGRVVLHGAPELDYALRLPGPGNVPAIVQPFRLDQDGDARVVVGTGATLRGRVGPRAVVDALRAEANASLQLGILLAGRGDFAGQIFPTHGLDQRVAALGEDGNFAIAGIPPGAWQPKLQSVHHSEHGSSTSLRSVGEQVALRDGETREMAIDLAGWVRQPVAVELRIDGAACEGTIRLSSDRGADASGEMQREYIDAKCDEKGHAEASLPEGEWSSRVWVRTASESFDLPGPRFAVMRGPEPMRVLIDLRTARRALLLLDPDGAPARHAHLARRAEGNDGFDFLGGTDADGRVTLVDVPRSLRLLVRRAPLADERAYAEWCNAQRSTTDGWHRAWLDVGLVELIPGGGEPMTIRLPPEWRDLPK